MSTEERRPPAWWLPEITLVGLTVALALSFARLFSGWDWLIPVLAPALVVHASEAAARRARLSVWIAPLIATVLGLITWVNLTLPETTRLGLPGVDTVPRFIALTGDSFETFRKLVAPAPAQPGFIAAASLALLVVALYSDTAAHRGNVPVQAVTTHIGVFIFGATLARGPGQLFSAVVFTAALGAHLLAVRTVSAGRGRWRSGERTGGTWAAARIGAGALAVAVLGGTVAHLAFTQDRSPVVDLTKFSSDRADREVLSPLVSVADQLGPQSNNVMFTVESTKVDPTYWRLTALDSFENNVWSSTASYEDAAGRLPEVGALPSRTIIDQTVAIDGLTGIWMPAAADPVEVASEIPASFDQPSATLIVTDGNEMPQGMTYAVRSAIPNVSAPVAKVPRGDEVDAALALPTDLSTQVSREAKLITEGVQGDLPKLQALQNDLRKGEYDTSADYRGAADPTAAFLESRRGFCTQYASAFVLMARSLGFPARLGVGFTPGNYDEATATWTVTGRQAHAWPEVFLPDYGWVAFEPTPGRGNPVTEPLTGVPFEQDSGDGNPEPVAPATTAPPTTTASPTPSSVPSQGADPGPVEQPKLAVPEQPRSTPWWLIGLVALLALASGGFAGRIAWVRNQRSRRYTPADANLVPVGAWAEVTDRLAMRRHLPRAAETAHEFARRAETETGLATLEPLSDLAAAGTFGDTPLDDDQVEQSRRLATSASTALTSEWSRTDRLRWMLGLIPSGRGRPGPG
ncbi:DUF3488 and transglutaminase-like domain-containing protein [Candidatus Microthrix parvicella]|uniref:DUF3488 and transglutaminase-like domain-containing protein n=1 Tax=Candidatus Neomicrothrix parvicella TaxID=41950 RepID=UPI0012FE6BC4|nr:DUF3488 and transglutaminase-like domain-containing protein [Candidatus Microthrix parvicella]